MKNSKMMSLSKKDVFKSIILLALTALILGVYDVLQTGVFPLTWVAWQPILASAASACLAYIIKSFLTNSEDKFLKLEKPDEKA